MILSIKNRADFSHSSLFFFYQFIDSSIKYNTAYEICRFVIPGSDPYKTSYEKSLFHWNVSCYDDHFEECVPFQLFRMFFILINLKSSSYIWACIELLVRFHEPWFFL